MPVFDMLIRESIRLSQAYVAFRRNVGPEMYIDGKVIPTGALVAYPAADIHVDPAFYPDPWKFDPTRPQPQGNLTYLGWGGGVFLRLRLLPKGIVDTQRSRCQFFPWHRLGRTTCIGSRLARLNIKLITALLLMDFDFDTVDAGGRVVDSPPRPNWNDPFGCRPAQSQFFLKYRRLDNPESLSCGLLGV
jgi:cytochrome P450